MQEAKEQFEQEMEDRRQEMQEKELSLEPQFAEIVASLVEKITGVLCQDKKDTIVYLIHQALKQLERTQTVTLRVSKEDILLVSGKKEELKQCVAQGVSFEVMEDESLGANQCIIETDNKMIDCSLDVQLQNVKEQIRMLTIL
jgi:flagellar assembly protein FliH